MEAPESQRALPHQGIMRHLIDKRTMVREELGGQSTTISRRQVSIGVLQLCIYIVVNLRSNYCTSLPKS